MCVTTDDEVWSTYLQSHKSASQFRGKTIKHFNELTVVFGSDRVAGGDATSHLPAAMHESDSADNVNPEHANEHVASQSVADIGSPTANSGSTTMSGGRKRKAQPEAEALAQTIERTSDKMEASMVKLGKDICDAIKHVELKTQREQLLQALLNMPALSQDQVIMAYQRFADKPSDIELFFGLALESRLPWVQ